VLTIFSMQGWGKLTAAIMNYALIATLDVFGGPWELDATWRFALAFGCALNILTIYFRWHLTESKIYTETKAKEASSDAVENRDAVGSAAVVSPNPLHASASAEKLMGGPQPTQQSIAPIAAIASVVKPSLDWRKSLRVLWEFKYVLIGTASTWFLMDGA
jgi:hypothetical protein